MGCDPKYTSVHYLPSALDQTPLIVHSATTEPKAMNSNDTNKNLTPNSTYVLQCVRVCVYVFFFYNIFFLLFLLFFFLVCF